MRRMSGPLLFSGRRRKQAPCPLSRLAARERVARPGTAAPDALGGAAHTRGVSARSEWRIAKTEAVAPRAMVATDHPLATEAGLAMLREGGNAVDAAVAAAFVMGVVEPFTSGAGGVASMVVSFADRGSAVVIDGSTTAPRAAREDMYELLPGGTAGMYGWPATRGNEHHLGYRSVAAPGAAACLCHAVERYGRLGLARVMAPAIGIAEEGFDVDWYLALAIAGYADRLWQNDEAKRTFYREGGLPLRPPLGLEPPDRLVQRDLAGTLRAIAAEGPDVVYRGRVANAIVRDMAEHGGLLARDDLAAYRVRELEPLRAPYRGYEILTVPETAGGVTLVEALNILEGYELQDDVATLHLVAEASRRAFLDRFAYLADPAFVDAPFARLVSKEYAAEVRGSVDPRRADPDARPGPATVAARAPAASPAGDHTTHISVVDQDRTMVALTSTLGQAFGSGVVSRGTGLLLADAMTWFDPRPGRVNSIAPGKRILWAVAPALLFRDGNPFLAVGAPGGRKLITAVLQTIVNVIDRGLGPQDAVNEPRIHAEGRETLVDARVAVATREALARMGHVVSVREETFASSYFGRPNAILVDAASGALRGGVNRLKPSLAAGH